jgi:hypothetical protein
VLPLDGVPVAADGGEAEAEVVVEEREAAYDFGDNVLGELRPTTAILLGLGGITSSEAGDLIVVPWGLGAPPPVAGCSEPGNLLVVHRWQRWRCRGWME